MTALLEQHQPVYVYAPVITAVFSMIAVLITFVETRKRQYRHEHVFEWCNNAIRLLQELAVTTQDTLYFSDDEKKKVIARVCVESSVLVELGRMFFRNEPSKTHGRNKPPAYRGYRPRILDPLVVAHEITKDWEKADFARRQRLAHLAYVQAREFVSMAQEEIGRSKAAAKEPARGGKGFSLNELLKQLPQRNDAG